MRERIIYEMLLIDAQNGYQCGKIIVCAAFPLHSAVVFWLKETIQ